MKRKKGISDLKKHKFLYLLALPGLIHILLFDYFPYYYLQVAFKDYSIFRGVSESPWVGFQNFIDLFETKYFTQALGNTLIINFYNLAFGFFVPVVIAILLNEIRMMFFVRTVQSILYLPHFLSWVIIGGLFTLLLDPNNGIVNLVLGWFGIDPIFFMTDRDWFRSVLVFSHIWKEAGWGSIIYLAAIIGNGTEQYESAIVDRANRFQRMRYITFPALIPTMLVLLLLQVSKLLKLFEQVFVMYNPIVAEVSETLGTYVYQIGIMRGDIAFATAVGLFNSILSLVLVLGVNKIVKMIRGTSII